MVKNDVEVDRKSRQAMNRQQLEKIRDSYKPGDWVQVVKNTWHRPGTIGKMGQIIEEWQQFTPTVRVCWGVVKDGKHISGFSDTFSPDDVTPCPNPKVKTKQGHIYYDEVATVTPEQLVKVDDLAANFNNSCPLCDRHYIENKDLEEHMEIDHHTAKQRFSTSLSAQKRGEPRICQRCGCGIGNPNYQNTGETQSEALEREIAYRKNFPNTWDKESGRVLVCDECFREMQADTDDFERNEL
jgi:hypothetical protein